MRIGVLEVALRTVLAALLFPSLRALLGSATALAAVSAWLAIQVLGAHAVRASSRRDVCLAAFNAACWTWLLARTGLSSSPWAIGPLLEIGIAAMRASARACVLASVGAIAVFCITAGLDPAPESRRALLMAGASAVLGAGYCSLLWTRGGPESRAGQSRTADVAHGIKNRLHAVQGFAELLADDLTPEDPRYRFAQSIRNGLDDANVKLADLMAAGRDRTSNSLPVAAHIRTEVQRAIETCDAILRRGHSRLISEVPADLAANIDAADLRTILIELIENAIEAMQPNGGVIEIAGCLDPPGLLIRDSGPGIARGDLERVSMQRFTTRPNGHGLGLSGARRLLEARGGAMQIESPPDCGAQIAIRLPPLSAATAVAARPLGGRPI